MGWGARSLYSHDEKILILEGERIQFLGGGGMIAPSSESSAADFSVFDNRI